MKILIFGAGVLGSLYAARLHASGQDVTILARGKRLEELRQHGLVLFDLASGQRTQCRLRVIDSLEPGDAYDTALIFVRKEQLPGVLPVLQANHHIPSLVFMSNNAAGADAMVHAVGRQRVLLGFAGAGGIRVGHVVQYLQVSPALQPTMLGELDGSSSPRLRQLAGILAQAGFPVSISPSMNAWLKTHVVWITAVSNAVYAAGGDIYRLSDTPDALVLMVRAVKEGLAALKSLGIPILPRYLRLAPYLPEPLLAAVVRRQFATRRAELLLGRYAVHSRAEMRLLSDELFQSIAESGQLAPAYNSLYEYADPLTAPLARGSRRIPMRWSGFALWAREFLEMLFFWRPRRNRTSL